MHKEGNSEVGKEVDVEEEQTYARERHLEVGVGLSGLGPSILMRT